MTALPTSSAQNAVKIKTKDGDRLHLQAPNRLTGDYNPDFEGTVDEGLAADMQVCEGVGVKPQWVGHVTTIRVDGPGHGEKRTIASHVAI